MASTVLLIDDDEDDALFFSEALMELAPGMKLEHCTSGVQALDKLIHQQIEPPDIIFMDLNMPALNGWDCLREIKNIAGMQHIPIVMYSTADLSSSGPSSADVGATAFFQKSNSFTELKNSLAEVFKSVLHY